jgi:protein subunit release factor B
MDCMIEIRAAEGGNDAKNLVKIQSAIYSKWAARGIFDLEFEVPREHELRIDPREQCPRF